MEAEDLNLLLKEMSSKYKNLVYLDTWKPLEFIPKSQTFEADGYHYDANQPGAVEVSKIINQMIKQIAEKGVRRVKEETEERCVRRKPLVPKVQGNKPAESSSQVRIEMDIEKDTASYYVGKKEKR